MKRMYSLFAIAVMAMVLNGCAALGIAAPETFNQQLAVGYGTVTQLRESATMLVQTKKLSPADAMNVQMTADSARIGLDTARTIHAADPAAGQVAVNVSGNEAVTPST
jgi:outer membrane lipoprotein SlyB